MNRIAPPRWYVSIDSRSGVKFGTASVAETREEATATAMALYAKQYPEYTAGEDFWLDRVWTWAEYVESAKK